MGRLAGFKLGCGLWLFVLTERGLMNGRDGASTADTGSPRRRVGRRPERSSSSLVSSDRCSSEGGGGDRAERDAA